MSEKTAFKRLARNFHKTFKPERHYISAMLRFAAARQSGNLWEISQKTGIPMGKSSGKVPAILDYCRGMGLLKLPDTTLKKPKLTEFGRIVLLEDPFLKTEMSQWLAHFHLCSPLHGADVWYHSFFAGAQSLGHRFSKDNLEAHLKVIYGVNKARLLGPLLNTYNDEAALKVCGALTIDDDDIIQRRPAPLNSELFLGYGAWVLQLINNHFPGEQQVTETELDLKAGWRTIPGWDKSSWQNVLGWIEQKGLLSVDRHMQPWLLSPRKDVREAWKAIFDDMI